MRTVIEIKNRWNGSILFQFECETILDCLKEAIKANADLSGANLSGADLKMYEDAWAEIKRAQFDATKINLIPRL